MEQPKTAFEFLAAISGMAYGLLNDPLAWVGLIICFAAGFSNRSFLFPIVMAIGFQTLVLLIVRNQYHTEYGSFKADQYLLEDQLPFLLLRMLIFWTFWLAAWKLRILTKT